MNFTKENRYSIFKVSWLLFMMGVICDLNIADKLSIGSFNLNIQLSSITAILYLVTFIFNYPINEYRLITKLKFDKFNIIIFSLLLAMAFISSYLSVVQKYAIVNTASRYMLFFLAMVTTIGYCRYFEKSNEFILKSFIYFNFIIALSCLADYFIPSFNRILVDHFGHMESRHSRITLGSITYQRPSGFITDTNLSAFTLAISSFYLLINREKFNKYFEYFFYIIAGICSGMMASRSAYILATFLLLLVFVIKQVQWKNVVIYSILFLAIQLITPQMQARFIYISDEHKKTEELQFGRPLIWKADFIAMGLKPVIGIGTGVFFKQSEILIAKVKKQITEEQFAAAISDPNVEPKEGINPHNIFFTMQIEYGIIGTILFSILVLYNLFFLFSAKKYNALIIALGILFVSTISNYAPYYKYYLLIIIIFYTTISYNLKLPDDIQKSQ